ncbi:transcriptional regulator, LysR family [Actinokineospora spheciospongiae]|uniref:Transcriptional regulator, LysR family n=1 Tax=Actinokineospora spheciospongiae TaxID=909613 RepID=W7IQY9_9PSEU|nr:LysR family transcriptional regulator [Actinokineospora spheciospongiae]EWC58991.1 transcriptional regulator, LysR family [Actinokineospora spheciospongiae]
MSVELRHLRAFLAIAEEGTISRAAVRLHLSQPAVSRTLQQLEAHLGVRLVDRSTHHVRLTPAGMATRVRAEAAVAAVDDVLDAGKLGSWPLRVGHAWSAFGEYTVPLLRAWRAAHPETALELNRVDDRTAGLVRGRVDAALLRGQVRVAGLHTEVLLSEPRLAAVPASGPLAGRASVGLADLVGETIAVNPVSGTTSLDLWPADRRPAEAVEVLSTDDWITLIGAGHAVGITTTATVSTYPHAEVAYVPLTGVAPVPLVLAWTTPPSHPMVWALAELARAVVGRGPGGGGR